MVGDPCISLLPNSTNYNMCLEGEERTRLFPSIVAGFPFNDFDSNAPSFGQFDQLIDVEQHRSCAKVLAF